MLSATLLLAATLGLSPETKPAPALELHPVEQGIIDHTNAQRKQYGLPALSVDTHLMSSARRHCGWMARSGSLTHTTAQVAENIAMGQTSSAHAVQDWMNSPGHRANMLNGSYRRVGAAAYTSPGGQVFWCVQFLQ